MPPENDASEELPRTPLTRAVALPHEIGGYRIIRLLGEGGMGVVYLAEQHEPVHREVALKVLRAGANTDEIIARFEAERQVLALMEHPNITRVYDAGATESGLPYFAMERVVGFPITDYATTRQLAPRERVRLVIQVCRAVQHAHQKGVIHRDIKPSNVMVMETDGEPVVKIIDFGIAKATAPTAGSAKLTHTGMVIGTPAYMSPEQLMGEGKDVDTRSDVYAIGVVLYELIAGILPHGAAAEGGVRSLLDRHASGEAPAPSTQYAALELSMREALAQQRQTDPDALHRMMVGDLDCVILKSLDGERDRRYQSAIAFAEDLEHFLAFEPVSARPTSAAYRARKFVRRHRTGVAFAGTLFVLLVAVAIGGVLQARRLSLANARVIARQAQAEDLIDFMLGDLKKGLEPLGKLELLDAVGTKALAYFAAVPESELTRDEQFRRATAVQELGSVRLLQGKLPDAARLFKQSIALMAPVAASAPDNPAWQLGLAHNHYFAGSADWQARNVDSALPHFTRFVEISNTLLARFPDSLSYRAEVAYALTNIGYAKAGKGDARAALTSFESARTMLDAIVPRDTQKTDWIVTLGVLHNASGVARRKLGDLAGALREHRQELAIRERLSARDTANYEWRRHVGIGHNFLSEILVWTGDAAGAIAEARSARAIYARLVAHDGANVLWKTEWVVSGRRLGDALFEHGDNEAAARVLDSAQVLLASLGGAAAANPDVVRHFVATSTARGRVLARVGRAGEGLASLEQAVTAGEANLAKRPTDLDRRKLASDAFLARGDALDRPGAASGSTTSWARALVLVDSVARATKETEFLALQAGAMLRLHSSAEARPVVAELLARGYRRPSFIALLGANQIATP